MKYDLIIRNGTVVHSDGVNVESLAIADGKFVEIAAEISGDATEIIDAKGLHVFPGVIDSHVHFNEPGRTEWEGIATGSAAVAAGGGTCFFDMPLNSSPPVLDGKAFDAKLEAANAKSVTDFGIWGGLTPDSLEHMEELAERGVVGFKAFMSNSGIDDFLYADDLTLFRGMRIAAKLKALVAVHAESETLTAALTEECRKSNRSTVGDYLRSRPTVAEVDAIRRAILFARETGCALHIVHVSSAAGSMEVVEAKHEYVVGQNRPVDVTCETCPHYLWFCDEDAKQIGAQAKCAPPLRSREEVENLWAQLAMGGIDFIASDHSPAPASMKTSTDFFQVWGGIAGAQTLLPAMIAEGVERDIPMAAIAELTAASPAKRFGIAGKGETALGNDADLALLDLSTPYTLQAEDLMYRHKQSPFVGREFRGRVIRTIRRGETIFCNGKVTATAGGKLVRPTRR